MKGDFSGSGRMKYTLKNFPEELCEEYSCCEDMLEWKQGFEKELREEVKKQAPFTALVSAQEILGDEV